MGTRVRNEDASFPQKFSFIFQHNLFLRQYTFLNVPEISLKSLENTICQTR